MTTPLSWFKIDDAARALKVSTRTVERRIKSGYFPVRRDAAGRRLVGIPLSELPEETQAVAALESSTRNHSEAVVALSAALEQVTGEAKALRRDLRESRVVSLVALVVAGLAVVFATMLALVGPAQQMPDEIEPPELVRIDKVNPWHPPLQHHEEPSLLDRDTP